MVAFSYPTIFTGNRETPTSYGTSTQTAAKHDLDTFNELVLTYQDAVYRQAFWIMGEEEAAEDAAQEAFLRAYLHFHTFNGGPFLPWILRITTNYCLDQLRRQKIRKTTPLEGTGGDDDEDFENSPWLRAPGASVEEIVEGVETWTNIERCVHRLPADYRAAVILVDLQGLDYQEAATILGIPLGTFKSRLSRARALLQKWLQPERRMSLQ